jgi:hypothetical protein
VEAEASGKMLDIDTFRTVCKKVTEETDPYAVGLLMERMRVLLAQKIRYPDDYLAEQSIN